MERYWLSTLLLISALFSSCLQAGLVISGTRVIYPANEREVTLKLENKSHVPLLVQSWIDSGDPNSPPEESDAPFTIMPPVSRIEPTKAQTLRIAVTPTTNQATDRETLYWINVLEVPPQSKEDKNYLSIAYRNRLKVFYRPAALEDLSPGILEQVSWRLQGEKLIGKNPTPYYISYSSILLSDKGKAAMAGSDGGMIAPFSEQVFQVKHNGKTPGGLPNTVTANAINDYGAFVEKTYPLSR
ncbi:hypothetical protein Z042_15305 [Chania multitudinisentens RB-25]|uniref:Molecular chaperone n=1 Tax=Chania multitudinisentens RB-25 TaxID=1441930 RepID=W0LEV9_9GAMM|nr:fimbria/pilus periplasmic chaperone [Chania multitudinisentens]AHG20822.1 hypothetical protein Z042_15305 [Chania multitudinisentens RB-25]